MSGATHEQLPEGTWLALHDFGRWLGSWMFHVSYRLRVRGKEHIPSEGPVVLVANHTSFADGPVIFGALGRRSVFLIKREIFRGPLGRVLRRLGQLSVRRGEPDRTPLLAAVRTLRSGGVVGVFPEGGRGDGDVANAEHGAAWLARAGGAVVLPVACRGTRRVSGPARWRPRVDVVFGKPFQVPAEHGRAALAEGTERIRTALAGLVAELDEYRGDRRTEVIQRNEEFRD